MEIITFRLRFDHFALFLRLRRANVARDFNYFTENEMNRDTQQGVVLMPDWKAKKQSLHHF